MKQYTEAEMLELGKKYAAQREKDALRTKAVNKALTRLKATHLPEYEKLYKEELAKIS